MNFEHFSNIFQKVSQKCEQFSHGRFVFEIFGIVGPKWSPSVAEASIRYRLAHSQPSKPSPLIRMLLFVWGAVVLALGPMSCFCPRWYVAASSHFLTDNCLYMYNPCVATLIQIEFIILSQQLYIFIYLHYLYIYIYTYIYIYV